MTTPQFINPKKNTAQFNPYMQQNEYGQNMHQRVGFPNQEAVSQQNSPNMNQFMYDPLFDTARQIG